jgi:hypothetical protein
VEVTFETRLPMPSAVREVREFFGARHGLVYRDAGGGEMSFSGDGRSLRVALTAAGSGAVRVQITTETLGELVTAFRARVAPAPGAAPRRRRLAAGDDLQRNRRLMARQPVPPASTQARYFSVGGGLNPG